MLGVNVVGYWLLTGVGAMGMAREAGKFMEIAL